MNAAVWLHQFNTGYAAHVLGGQTDTDLGIREIYGKTNDGLRWMSDFDPSPDAISGIGAVLHTARRRYGDAGIRFVPWGVIQRTLGVFASAGQAGGCARGADRAGGGDRRPQGGLHRGSGAIHPRDLPGVLAQRSGRGSNGGVSVRGDVPGERRRRALGGTRRTRSAPDAGILRDLGEPADRDARAAAGVLHGFREAAYANSDHGAHGVGAGGRCAGETRLAGSEERDPPDLPSGLARESDPLRLLRGAAAGLRRRNLDLPARESAS